MRRILPTLAVLSLTLSAALAGLWVASYRWGYAVQYDWPNREAGFMFCGGAVSVEGGVGVFHPAPGGWRAVRLPVGMDLAGALAAEYPEHKAGRFGAHGDATITGCEGIVWCPLWAPVLLTAIPPAACLIRRKRRVGVRGFEVGAYPE